MLFQTSQGCFLFPPFYWISSLFLLTAIFYRKHMLLTPFPLIPVLLLFFIQVFIGFTPKTPLPFFLIILFVITYEFYIRKKQK
jgi:hypothetical protein